MSFILDALKKSESDRQRQGGPALFEVKVAPRRHTLPPWAVAIGVLLVANFGIVAWYLLRHATAAGETPGPGRALPAAQAGTASTAPAAGAAPQHESRSRDRARGGGCFRPFFRDVYVRLVHHLRQEEIPLIVDP